MIYCCSTRLALDSICLFARFSAQFFAKVMNCLVEFLHWLILVTRKASTRLWTFIVTELLPIQRHPERIVRSLRIGQKHPKAGLHREDSQGHAKDNNSLLENVFQVYTANWLPEFMHTS